MAIPGYIYGGNTGETQDTLARKRKVAEALMIKAGGAPKNVGEGLSAIGNALLYRSLMKKVDSGEKETAANAAMDFDAITGAFGAPSSTSATQTGGNMPKVDSAGNTSLTPSTFSGDVKTGIQSSADALGIDPVDLATAVSYETAGTFDPTKAGPTTQWGQHKGLIQFGEPQAQKYGVDWQNPVGSQLGPDGAVVKYLRDAGVKPGMGLMDIYSAINAGRVGRNSASDANNGGAPGTVADKVNTQMAGHREKALAMFADASPQPVDRGAMLADPSTIAPEDAARLSAMRGEPGATVPYSGPGAKIDQPMAVYDTEGLRMEPASYAGPQGSQSAADAIQQQAPLPVAGESLSDEAAAFRQTPEYAAQFPGQQVTPNPRVAAALAQPQGSAQAALPVTPEQDTARQPQVNPQVAQALLQGDRSGVGIGGAEPAGGYFPAQPNQAGQSGPSMQQLMQAAANPNLNDGQRAVVNALLQSRMETDAKRADPANALETEYKRAQIDALKAKPGERTPDQQNYEYYRDFETKAGRPPLGPLEWEQAQRKASASSTTVNMGESDKFYENLDKKNAETFASLSDTGMQARSKIAQIDRLEGLMANAPQGAVGALKQAAGEWGIATEGLSDIQASTALLEKMVPEQRAPGSGPMSDADIKMFRASLPRVINQPGGNQLIFGTMRGIAEYEMKMGEIADKVANREMKADGKVYTPADARRDIANLENPLSNYRVPSGPTPNQGVKAGDIEDGYRFKGGNLSDPNNWEKAE